MAIESKQSSPQITDSALRQPTEFPEIPDEVLKRFPSMKTWMDDVTVFWRKNVNAVDEFARAVLDVTEIAGVLVVDPNEAALYIRRSRGQGAWADPDTSFYVNRDGYFSLLNLLTFNPVERELIVSGTIIATAGEIGGFEIGTDYIRDVADSMGLSSAVSGADDVRFWAGDTFANRASAPFRVYESGAIVATNATITGTITATSGSIGGFNIGADYIRDVANSMGLASTVTGGDDVRLWAGAAFASRGTAPFRVTESGALVATSATISGSITASSGSIGGFDIGSDYLRDAANSFGLASTVTGGDDVRLWAGATFANRGTAAFRVTEAGALVATSATITGAISATSGSIGGFDVGTDYIRDTANSFGLASTVTGGNDVRFWAGDTFANRATAPLRFFEDGTGVIAGFTVGATSLSAVNGADAVTLSSAGGGFLQFDSTGSSSATFAIEGVTVLNSGGNFALELRSDASTATYGILDLYDGSGTATIAMQGSIGDIAATTFTGDGSALTGLSATNIASGTLANARLPTVVQLGDGSASTPTYGYINDTDTGWFLDGTGKNACTVGGATRFTVSTTTIACLVALKLNNNYVAGAVVPTGTLTIVDGAGTAYRFPVLV